MRALPSLAADAAAFALRDPVAGPGKALALLEAGRAVLLSQAFETRNDLTDLAAQHPAEAAEVARLRDQLDQEPDADALDSIQDRQRLAQKWSDLLTRIRALPEFGTFARPPGLDTLLADAVTGPIVVFNVSRYRSDALLLTDAGVACLPLPGLPLEAVVNQITAFYEALVAVQTSADRAERIAAQRRITAVLAWLWDNATEPVLDQLALPVAEDNKLPQIWLVPGGILGLLPLHAAGRVGSTRDSTVLDRVVPSYAPTVRALRYTRERAPAGPLEGPALVVAMPVTPKVPGRLHHVLDEARRVALRLHGSNILTNDEATRDAVLGLLPTSPIAHFACHGSSAVGDPSQSHLLLHDHLSDPLTVNALHSVRLNRAQLAFLSACETAMSVDTELLDEAIHLSSAFMLAGYPHVIGTLWTINDSVATNIADTFYANLTLGPARALHHAIREMRDLFPATPSLWAAHIHIGG